MTWRLVSSIESGLDFSSIANWMHSKGLNMSSAAGSPAAVNPSLWGRCFHSPSRCKTCEQHRATEHPKEGGPNFFLGLAMPPYRSCVENAWCPLLLLLLLGQSRTPRVSLVLEWPPARRHVKTPIVHERLGPHQPKQPFGKAVERRSVVLRCVCGAAAEQASCACCDPLA